ncbi:hypothetical protein HKCCE3408_18150 [Rhodobacterales bacterium HKCCE3408]|nr:hypothetical protein [Rhodobacterales bacterium HKCCE3408]
MTPFKNAAALAALLAAAPAAADVPPGRYDADPGTDIACTQYSNGAVDVTPDSLGYYESSCSLSDPVDVRGMDGATLYDAQCTGEGQSWTTRVMLMPGLEEDSIVIVLPGYATTYGLCK